jgi:outer membrane protein assembly factor BamB
LDKKTGEIKWKALRDSQSKKNFSFCTPLVVEVKGEVQIISPASDYVFAYDLEGNQLWKFNYPNGYSVVPRPVFDQGMVYVSSGFDSPTLYAIKCGGRGDITKNNLVWKTRKGAPRNSSVVVVNGLLFMVADNGVVSCLDSKTGELFWMERVAGSCSPSLLHSNGNIFLSDEMGKTFIFKASKSYALLATNDLEERMLASPIAFKNSLLLRTENNLWRIDP